MNQQQIKVLEDELWRTADNLRASSKLAAAEYKDPVLGITIAVSPLFTHFSI